MTGTVGIIANPRSGTDIRRLVASAGRSTLEDKVSIVRRVILGAAAVGVRRFVHLPEPHGIVRRATETLRGLDIAAADVEVRYDETDTVRTAAALRDLGCGVVVVLGGDGTNRAVTEGWPDVPLIPLSTGTNNAFPLHVEPTVAGTAAGLVATGAVAAPARRHKVVTVSSARFRDRALVDVVGTADPLVGSLELFEPDRLRWAVVTKADPAAIGFCGTCARVAHLGADEPGGLFVRFRPPTEPGAFRVLAPIAPGVLTEMGVDEVRRLDPDEPVTVEGPCVLAYDGERQRRLREGERAELRVRPDGPRVIDVGSTVAEGIARGAFGRGPLG